MFRKALLRSMATTVAVGTAFAGAALAAPATVAPSIANMSCKAQYQHSVVTKTHLSLSRTAGEFGQRNVAEVVVTSDAGVPTGRVRITTNLRSWTVTLDPNGYARHRLSRFLSPGTYPVSARYYPGCSRFGRSHSPRWSYTVSKAHTSVVDMHARNIDRGARPAVGLDVTTSTGVTPHGRVRIKLYHHSHLRRARTVRLHGGHGWVRFGRVWQRRSWQVTATYLGTRNLRRSASDTGFWVSRRG